MTEAPSTIVRRGFKARRYPTAEQADRLRAGSLRFLCDRLLEAERLVLNADASIPT